MRKVHWLVGLFVLVVGLVVISPSQKSKAAPAPCKQCTCKVSKTWAIGSTFWGLRKLNDDNTWTAMDHMYQAGGVVPTSWSATCDPGIPTPQWVDMVGQRGAIRYRAFTYASGNPDCAYGGTDSPLL